MVAEIILSLVLWTHGVLSIVYAFREPPARIAWLFDLRVPLLFALVLAFVQEHQRVKVARIGVGVVLLMGSLAFALDALSRLFLS